MTNFPEASSDEWEEEREVQAQVNSEQDEEWDKEAEEARLWMQNL